MKTCQLKSWTSFFLGTVAFHNFSGVCLPGWVKLLWGHASHTPCSEFTHKQWSNKFYHFVKNNLTRFQYVKKNLFERRFSIWKIFFNTRWNCNRKVPFLGGITLCSFYPELWLGIPNGDVQRSAILAILLVQFAFLPSTTSSQKFCGEWLFSKEYQTHFSNLYKKYFHSIGETPRVISSKFLFHKKKLLDLFLRL